MSREPILRLLDNPIGIAQARRRLRRKQAMPGFLVIALISMAVLALAGAMRSDPNSWDVARDLFMAGIAGILCLRGTGQVSATVAEDRHSGRLDSYRVTPTSAWTDGLGYVAGCAAREYVSALILTPFFLLASVLADGSLVGAFIALYVILATGLMCHVYGAFVGLVWRGERAASLAIGSLIGLVVITSSISSVHLAALSHLTPLPALRSLGCFNFSGTSIESFTYFGIPCTHVTFTLLFQGCVLAFIAWATARKLRTDSALAFTRRGALLLFALTTLFLIAPAWHRLNAPASLAAAAGTYLVLGVMMAGALAIALVPSFLGTLRMIRRTRRLDRPIRWHTEGSSSWPLVPCIGLLLSSGLTMILARGVATGALAQDSLVSSESALALAGCIAFVSLLFGALEYSRLVPRSAWRFRLALVGVGWLALPWLLGTGAAMLLAGSAVPGYLHASSPIYSVLGPVDSLVRLLGGQPQVLEGGQCCWAIFIAGASSLALWRGASRKMAGIIADEAAAGDLPSIDAFRDAG